MITQLAPSDMTVIDWFGVKATGAAPSIVCDDVVAMVIFPADLFLTVY